MMKVAALLGKHKNFGKAVYFLALLFLLCNAPLIEAFAQQTKNTPHFLSERKQAMEPLSDEARSRIAATIQATREQKLSALRAGTALKQGDNGTGLSQQPILMNAATMYSNSYFDTQPGTAFSFPEDTHDYCKAYFQNEIARPDFTLDATVEGGAELTVQLTWTPAMPGQVTDFDLYLFDESGQTVGDPGGVFPDGFNGIDFQSSSGNLIENAGLSHNGGTTESLYIVVDRFRGAAENSIEINIDGADGSFQVLEYVADDLFSYFDTSTGERLGTVSENQVIDLSAFATSPPEFTLVFETDDCAESLQFSLVDSATGDTIVSAVDNDFPYSIFGEEDGQLNGDELVDGMYELTVTPYSDEDAGGAPGPMSSLQFEITGNMASADSARITGFSLVDLSGDVADRLVRDINASDEIDLPLLPIGLNIEALLSDPASLAIGVEFELFTLPLDENPTPVIVTDLEALYLLFDPASVDTLSVGEYTLIANPVGAAETDPSLLVGAEVSFSVLGPRIDSYSFINADTDLVLPGLDSLENSIVLDISDLPQNVNIRANTVDYPVPVIDSAQLQLVDGDGAFIVDRIENFLPYSVFGDCNLALGCDRDLLPSELADYFPWEGGPFSGSFTLTGIPADANDVQFGPKVFLITITGSATGQAGQAPPLAKLLPNFPNPFNPVTTIRFGLPERMPVRVSVFDMLGREIKNLVDGTLPAGFHEVSFDAGTFASGMYMYRLETSESVEVRLMTLLK